MTAEAGKLSVFERWFDARSKKEFDKHQNAKLIQNPDLTLVIAFWPGPLTGVVRKGEGGTFEIKVRAPDGNTVREVATMTFNPEYVVFWYPADVPLVTKGQDKGSNIVLHS